MEDNHNKMPRDNVKETKKGLKEIHKIIFRANEDLPDDWAELEMSAEEAKILQEGEDYIEKVLAPSLSIYKKVSKAELEDDRKVEELIRAEQSNFKDSKEVKSEAKLNQDEVNEIDKLLKLKAQSLKKDKLEKEVKKELNLEEEEKKKKKELEERNR